MRILKNYIIIVQTIILLMMGSCIKDDGGFPDQNKDTIVSSVAIVTILQNFGKENNSIREENQCFRFVYPIVMGYNTDAAIEVESYSGLIEILKSQRLNFNISGLQFPLQVIFKGSDAAITIEDEAALINILGDCQFSPFRQDFDQFWNRCFRLKFPVTLFDKKVNDTLLNSEEEFIGFLTDQGESYQPNFKYPVAVLKEPTFDAEIEIQTSYGFYRIFESCRFSCPSITISEEVVNDLTLDYVFFATSTDPDVTGFSWSVNGEVITDQNVDQFRYEFPAPGRYAVCVAIETPECPNGIEKCIDVLVSSKCIDLSFVWDRLPQSFEHRFMANFDRKENVIYQWFVDDELIEEDGGPDGDHILETVLRSDSLKVCLKTRIRSCPGEELDYCEIIPVEQDCPDLFFMTEQIEPTQFEFYATFEGIKTITYSWFIDDVLIEEDGGPDGDNKLSRFFEVSGNYNICIKTTTPNCFSPLEFCEQITIP